MSKPNQNPILLSFPESFETQRLLIRSPMYGDGVLVHKALHESAAELRPWMLGLKICRPLKNRK